MSQFVSPDEDDMIQQGYDGHSSYAGNGEGVGEEDEANLAELDEEFNGADEEDDQDSIDEDMAKQMDELTKDMESFATTDPPTGEAPVGAVPTDKSGRLSAHAAEFWFPECRSCVCCSGFKHGCECVKARKYIACQHESCTVDPAHRDQKLTEGTSPRAENSNSGSRRGFSESTASQASAQMCRFEQSAGGCRFGSSCRYRHSGKSSDQFQHGSLRSFSTGNDFNGNYNGGNAHGNHRSPNNKFQASSGGSYNENIQAYAAPQGSNNLSVSTNGPGNYYSQQHSPQGQYYPQQYGYGAANPSYPPHSPTHGQQLSPQGRSEMAASSPRGPSDQMCPYFLKGECRFGVSCRNKHA